MANVCRWALDVRNWRQPSHCRRYNRPWRQRLGPEFQFPSGFPLLYSLPPLFSLWFSLKFSGSSRFLKKRGWSFEQRDLFAINWSDLLLKIDIFSPFIEFKFGVFFFSSSKFKLGFFFSDMIYEYRLIFPFMHGQSVWFPGLFKFS